MKREKIIAHTLRTYQRTNVIDPECADMFAEHGQESLEESLQSRQTYSPVIVAELERRLTEREYLTCVDFDHFDVNCCANCHTGYPHYDMYIVDLDNGGHAWVCCPMRNILMREVRMIDGPDAQGKLKIPEEIVGCPPDPVEIEFHAANLAAQTDEEHLRYCLAYAHHVYGRARGHLSLDALVSGALRLPGRVSARECKLAGGQSISGP